MSEDIVPIWQQEATDKLSQALGIDRRELIWQRDKIFEIAQRYASEGKDFEPKDILDEIEQILQANPKPWETDAGKV